MKKRATTTTTTTSSTSTTKKTVAIFVALFIFFLIDQITLLSISLWSPIKESKTSQGNHIEELKPKQNKAPPKTDFSAKFQPIKCDNSHFRYNICFLNSTTVLKPTVSTLFLVEPTESSPTQIVKVRPYPRKWETNIMSRIKELTLTTAPFDTQCEVHHNSPALVFSTGGYTGNVFHDFNEGFIPLFITIQSTFPDQNPILVIANCQEWWLNRYAELIRQFTPYPIINLDTENTTHCFTSATVGLISHGYMTIDPKLIPQSDTFYTFRTLLGNSYLPTKYHISQSIKPRLVLVSRKGGVGRVIRNQAEVVEVAEQSGFEVVLFEPNKHTCMSNAYGLINSSHAMFGVHGAALTHLLFLRPGSVFIQVVPIGTVWLSETCYANPAKDMGLEYMEYKIRVQESSLVEKYGTDHLVLKDPKAVANKEFANTKNIYLKGQDVILNLGRVEKYLRKAYKKVQRFMDKEGQSTK